MIFNETLNKFRSESFTQKDKETQFERLIRSWLLSDPRYLSLIKVWLWEDSPSRNDLGEKDTGIDLVARTDEANYWAIQCKCYKENAVIDKPAADSFLATSSRQFKDPETLQTISFARRVWISTTNYWVENVEDFMASYKADKTLADLHLNYELVPVSPNVTVEIVDTMYENATEEKAGYTEFDKFVVKKMVLPKVRNEAGKLVADKFRIIYNGNVAIEDILAKAYDHVINGKSATEWIRERYAVTQDSKSLMVNAPNDWNNEHNKPRYILDLLHSVINLSIQSVGIVNLLSKLTFDSINLKN